jgi:hypothetical protein
MVTDLQPRLKGSQNFQLTTTSIYGLWKMTIYSAANTKLNATTFFGCVFPKIQGRGWGEMI